MRLGLTSIVLQLVEDDDVGLLQRRSPYGAFFAGVLSQAPVASWKISQGFARVRVMAHRSPWDLGPGVSVLLTEVSQ